MSRCKDDFSNIEIEEMIQLHYDGKINKDIAKIYNTSPTMISRIFKDNNIPSKHPKLSEERKLLIKEYYEKTLNKKLTCKDMHCGEKTLNDIIQEFDLFEPSMSDLRKKYKVNDYYFNVIDTQNKAYSLGILYADGTVKESQFAISLQERDKDIIDKLNHEFGGDRKLTFIEYSKKNPNWQNQYMLSISNKQMCNDLIKHGCVPNKSLILKFPTSIPNELIRHFVRGIFDGDGYISKKEDRCTLISTNDFCIELAEIVKSELNVNSSIMYCHNNIDKPTRTFQIAGKRQVKKFLDWLYVDSELFLERKYKLYLSKYYSDINNTLSD